MVVNVCITLRGDYLTFERELGGGGGAGRWYASFQKKNIPQSDFQEKKAL